MSLAKEVTENIDNLNEEDERSHAKVKLRGEDYDVNIMDSSHFRMKGKGDTKWGSPYHVGQMHDEVKDQLKHQGLFHGNFLRDDVWYPPTRKG